MRPATLLAAAFLLMAGVVPISHCASRRPVAMASVTAHPEMEPSMGPSMEASAEAATAAIVPVVSDDPFVATVRPVLSVRCAPCHEPGGKMYARLPFDDSKTVSTNSAGILRRLKGDDRAALEKWLAGLEAAATR